MKVLMLSYGRKIEDQIDFDIAFRAAKSDGQQVELRNIPFMGCREQYGEVAYYQEILRQNEDFKPDLVFFQFYHFNGDTGIADCCRALKASSNSPLIFGSIGDPFWTDWRKYFARPLPRSVTDLVRHTDAFFATAFGNVADELARQGGKNIIFLPHAFLPAHFPYWADPVIEKPEYDVIMLGNRQKLIGRKPAINFYCGCRRYLLVKNLVRHLGNKFSVFGRGWGDVPFCKGPVAFNDQVRIFHNSRVVVDAPAPILSTDYYASDRPFFILASGTLPVYVYTPRFEKMFREGEHLFYAYKLRDVGKICKKALALPDDLRKERAKRIQEFVKERHLINHRIDTILSTAEALQQCRRGEITKEEALRAIRMHHFLPEVNMEEEYKFCTRNWVG